MNARMVACDALVRKIVRARSGGRCERCHVICEVETAHIIRRAYQRTRCDTTNVRGLCPNCHRAQHRFEWEWPELIGADEHMRLFTLANDPTWKRPHGWWTEVAAVLRVELATLEEHK